MTIEKLLEILPPPLIPYPNVEIDWEAKEKILGKKFPEDYKAFIKHYGFVMVAGDLTVYLPEKVFLELNSFKEHYADIVKFKYDNKSGDTIKEVLDDDLIPWGSSTIGGYFFWKFDPIKPYVVSYDWRGIGREEYPNYSLTEFIYGLLTRTISCEAAGDYDIEDRIVIPLLDEKF